MLCITNRGFDAVKEFTKEYFGKVSIISFIHNAMYIKYKNNCYTYLKNGCFLPIDIFKNDYLLNYFYFLQIKEIDVDEQEKYKELALSKIKNIDDINDIQFKGFYLIDKNTLYELE